MNWLQLWFSQVVYERIIGRYPHHPLVRLAGLIEVGPMVEGYAGFHQGSGGRGRPPVHSVGRLARALLVKYLYNLSLRELEERLELDLAVKWFVGYRLFERGPDHSTLARFELYVLTTNPRLYFDTALRQIDAAFPQQRRQPQLGDSFALLADARKESLINRLRHTGYCLLLAVATTDPAGFQALLARRPVSSLLGEAEERAEFLLDQSSWRKRLLTTVQAVYDYRQQLGNRPCLPSGPLRRWLALVDKLLADELALTLDEQGQVRAARLLAEKERGHYRLVSATDPAATIRNHGKDKVDFGYNASVAATTDIIREIRADSGSRPDAEAIPDLLTAQAEHHDLWPAKFIYDQAAGHGQTMAAVHQVSGGQTQLVVKPIDYQERTERLGPLDCALDEAGALTCPGGVTTTTRYRSASGQGDNYRIPAAACAACPLSAACRGDSVRPDRHRQFFVSDHRATLLQAITYSQTPEFRRDMRLRPQIERVIAGLVLHNGARRARFRGLLKVDFQMKMCATAYNLKRWLQLALGQQRPPPARGPDRWRQHLAELAAA